MTDPGHSPPASPPDGEPRYFGQFDPPVDRFLHERYFDGRTEPGVALECGAFDGVIESSCLFFERYLGWRTINIEASPPVFAKLLAQRPGSVNLNVALSDREGLASFVHVVHPVLGEQFGNGSLGHAEAHLRELDAMGCTYQRHDVPVATFRALVAQMGLTGLDLMVLDVEGHELEVIDGMKGSNVLPQVLCIEVGHLGLDAVRARVEPLGYVFDTTSWVNAYFLRADVAEGYLARIRAREAASPPDAAPDAASDVRPASEPAAAPASAGLTVAVVPGAAPGVAAADGPRAEGRVGRFSSWLGGRVPGGS